MFSTGNISTNEIGLLIQRLTAKALKADVKKHLGNVMEVELTDSLAYMICVVPMSANKNDVQTYYCIDLDPNDIRFEGKMENTPPFLLLGYDIINDVYVMWNPAIVKFNLSNCDKRYSYYANIAELKKTKEGEISDILTCKGVDLCYVHRNRLADFPTIIEKFNYDDEGIKAAIVSQYRLLGQKESFDRFVAAYEKDNLCGYAQYLEETVKISPKYYPGYIRRLFRENILGTKGVYSYLFSNCHDLMLYHKPIDELLRILETKTDIYGGKNRMDVIRATGSALRLYLEYLNNEAYLKEQSEGYAAPGRFTCNFNKLDRIKIITPDGKTIYPRRATDALAEIIKMAGIEKVWRLKLTGFASKNGMPLICKGQDLVKHKKSKIYYSLLLKDSKNVSWYLFRYSTADVKRRTTKKISEKLNLGLHVYLIRSIGTRSTEQENFYQFKDSEIEFE